MSTRTATGASILDDIEGLRALARSLVRGDSEADDLLQDAAEIAITHPPDEDRPARPWLVAVLRNRWRMDRRGDARRRAREHAVASDAEKLTSRVDGREGDARIDDPLDRARTLERLSTALVALADPYRTAVIRRYLDGETAAQIGVALGVPAGTVRWRLKEGLARLRSAMNAQSPDWKRVLIPLVAVPGAVVKTKSTVGIAGGGYHPKIEAGMTAVDGGELGPLVVALTKLEDGEIPTTELVGIGVQLTADADSLVATKVFPGSGALAAGIVSGDHIVALDGILVTELGMEDSIAHIRGVPGTSIVVSVKRGEQVIPLTVERKKIMPQ